MVAHGDYTINCFLVLKNNLALVHFCYSAPQNHIVYEKLTRGWLDDKYSVTMYIKSINLELYN